MLKKYNLFIVSPFFFFFFPLQQIWNIFLFSLSFSQIIRKSRWKCSNSLFETWIRSQRHDNCYLHWVHKFNKWTLPFVFRVNCGNYYNVNKDQYLKYSYNKLRVNNYAFFLCFLLSSFSFYCELYLINVFYVCKFHKFLCLLCDLCLSNKFVCLCEKGVSLPGTSF